MTDLTKLSNEELIEGIRMDTDLLIRFVIQDKQNEIEIISKSYDDTLAELLRRLNAAPRWIPFDDKDNPPPQDGTIFIALFDIDTPHSTWYTCHWNEGWKYGDSSMEFAREPYLYQLITPPQEATHERDR